MPGGLYGTMILANNFVQSLWPPVLQLVQNSDHLDHTLKHAWNHYTSVRL